MHSKFLVLPILPWRPFNLNKLLLSFMFWKNYLTAEKLNSHHHQVPNYQTLFNYLLKRCSTTFNHYSYHQHNKNNYLVIILMKLSIIHQKIFNHLLLNNKIYLQNIVMILDNKMELLISFTISKQEKHRVILILSISLYLLNNFWKKNMDKNQNSKIFSPSMNMLHTLGKICQLYCLILHLSNTLMHG